MAINVKRTAGHCKRQPVSFKAGKKQIRFKARKHCGVKTPAQKRASAAGVACASEGPVGGKKNSTCLRKLLRSRVGRR